MFSSQLTLFEKNANTSNITAHLYIISGPSGVGKTTIIDRLLKDIPQLEKIVGYTTRNIRKNEIPDQTYHYINREEFKIKKKHDDFLEHLKFNGNYYGFGLAKHEVLSKLSAGTDLLVDMDYSQINDLKMKIPHCIAIFIKPPTIETLRTRLSNRGESELTIEQRMQLAQDMIDHATICDFVITNEENKLDSAIEEIKSIIMHNKLDKSPNSYTK